MKFVLRIVSSPGFGRRLARDYTPKNKQLKHCLEGGEGGGVEEDDENDTFIAIVRTLLKDAQRKRSSAISGETSIVELERSLNILHNSIAVCGAAATDESMS